MALERSWQAVPARLFTSNGTSLGIVTVENSSGFYTKSKVVLKSDTNPNGTEYKVLRVLSPTQILVGKPDAKIGQGSQGADLSAYTVLLNSTIEAPEQDKGKIPHDDHYLAVYEADPIVADRVIQVDEHGNFYGPGNPMPIAFDGTVSVGNVTIQDDDGDELNINTDGSINVNILPSTSGDNTVRNIFGVANAVVSGATTTIVTYTCPTGVRALLQRSVGSGTNIGTYTLAINGVTQGVLRNYFAGEFNVTFDFTTGQENGLVLEAGDVVTLKILHNRPFLGDFDGRIQVFEVTL